METPADPTQEPIPSSATEPTDDVLVGDQPDRHVVVESTGLSGLRLAVTSIGVFLAIVAIGGAIGLASGAGVDDADAMAASVMDSAALDSALVDTPALNTSVDTAIVNAAVVPETSIAPAAIVASPPTAPVVDNPEPEAVAITTDDVTVNEPVTVVRGVTELALPLVDDAPPAATITGPDPTEIEFLELPKAVYDRFTLRTGDSFAINIAANDKIGGVLQSVTLTGLGELAPGFSLNADGTVSGVASQCGAWKAQYAINSTNPAVGTSWIDITVSGCSGT